MPPIRCIQGHWDDTITSQKEVWMGQRTQERMGQRAQEVERCIEEAEQIKRSCEELAVYRHRQALTTSFLTGLNDIII